jgi:hypothetical protein
VKESTLGNPTVEACLLGITAQLRYASAPSGEETKVVFPFVFKPE